METVTVRTRLLPHAAGLPEYSSDLASGADVRAALSEDLVLNPGSRALVPTGLSLEIPDGFEVQVRPRSGMAAKHGVTCLNAPGTVDADYRGEVMVLLANLGSVPFTVTRGDRIAQLVVAPVARGRWEMADVLETSARGTGGFGSTGQR